MPPRTIPQRELRNEIGRVLREAEAGTEFLVTVRGRPVARLGPPLQPDGPSVDVDLATVRRILAASPVDEALSREIREMRDAEAPAGSPWPDD